MYVSSLWNVGFRQVVIVTMKYSTALGVLDSCVIPNVLL